MTDGAVALPPDWVAQVGRLPPDGGPSGAEWVRRVPRLLEAALARWELIVAGAPRTGWTAVVVPVESAGIPLALKVVWPHPEALGEHLALRVWDGHGAVRLVAAEPHDGALLLQRLDADRDLTGVPIDQACEIIGRLLAGLHVPAPGSIVRAQPMSGYLERHLRTLAAAGPAVPRRIVDRVLGLARELLQHDEADPANRLLHTDLHFENVLALPGQPDRWVAIDPKPMAGHPGFELQPVLRNRIDELGTGSAFRWSIRRRLSIVAEAAGVDEEAMRLWSIVHTGLLIGWAAKDGDRDGLSAQIPIVKALED